MMVIFIHVTSKPLLYVGGVEFAILYTLQRFCGVAVYGFIFLSAMKLFLKDCSAVSCGKYILSRIVKIYIPYVVATVLYYFFEIYRGYYVFDVNQLISFIVTGNGECHLYFVVIIMQFYLLLPLWQKLLSSRYIWIYLAIAAFVNVYCVYELPNLLGRMGIRSFEYNDRVFTSYVFFWIVGCVCGRHYQSFVKLSKRALPIMSLLLLITLWADVSMSAKGIMYGIYYPSMDVVHLVYVAVAVFALYCISLVPKVTKVCTLPMFKVINEASFQIYLFHVCVVVAAGDFLNRYPSLGHLERWAISLPLIYIISISSCVLYNYLKKQLKRRGVK